jgi:hypothetical protein
MNKSKGRSCSLWATLSLCGTVPYLLRDGAVDRDSSSTKLAVVRIEGHQGAACHTRATARPSAWTASR